MDSDMANNEKPRLVSIGLGWWGGMLAQGAQKTGEAEVAGCFARTEATRNAFAEKIGCEPYDSLEDVWADDSIDAVIVATPHGTRAEIVEAAAAAGKHAFVEKPLALTVEEADRIIAATRAAGVVLQVGYNKRRQAGNRWLQEQVRTDALGQVQGIETSISVPIAFKPDLPEWRQTPDECPAGGMTGLGVHMVDAILHLGGPVREVYCRSNRVSKRLDVDDVTMVLMEHESGVLAYLGTMIAVPNTTTIAVHGTEAAGFTEADGAAAYLIHRGEMTREAVDIEPIDTVADEMAEFVRCIRTGDEPETGAEVGRAVTAVFEAIVESARTGTSVAVRA
jgi:predicted dehydrogenase